MLMDDDGWLSIEVHHALNLVRLGQFDTIYHEHFQYYTLFSAICALATAGLAVVDVETEAIRHELLRFLLQCRADGKRVVGYGAPGKGNTLLNYCGIRTDLLEYTVDRNPYKHGRFTPGTRIPIHGPERIAVDRPEVVVALPWNLETELTEQLGYIADWGGQLVFPLPTLHTAEIGSVRR
jgi:hypothetical protein